MTRRTILAAAGLALSVCLPGDTGAQEAGPVRKRSAYEDLQMFSQVLNHIRVNHPDSIDSHELIAAAIEGMLRAADPHSYVVTRVRLDPRREEALRKGKLHPVPIAFEFFGGAPVVVAVAPGSAASRTDILPGDELVAIGGTPVSVRNVLELEVTLAGDRNAPVSLTFARRRSDGSIATVERAVKREKLDEISAVPAAFLLDAETGYVRITGFTNDQVADDVHDALGRLEKLGMRRLVLDVRDNGGGLVDEAAKVAGEFLPKGTILYTQDGRKADVADTGRVGRSFWSRERRYPVVVLINHASASASELVVGALQDHDRALVVGRPSFGKSLLMQGFPLSDGSVAVMVIGHVRTPCGRIVQRQYRDISTRDYYRLARADRDTAGRPSCTTAGGRRVYGGGGIVPDVLLEESTPTPVWLARAHEQGVVLQWVGGHVEASGATYSSADALAGSPSVAPAALADFRRFAAAQGVAIPDGAAADALLQRELVREIARAKWGDVGYYRVDAALDPQIGKALETFGEAERILGTVPP